MEISWYAGRFFRGVRQVKKAKGGKSLDGRVSSRQNLVEAQISI